ncbi:cupin domain-containing protein [Clostridium sp. MSJ-11]|uniref:Cupin domain-containing protein n=1 Tax=Clostridium mobile TaxID=2841512 RepID=A0ABS6EKU1_9CLOT|nr:cupin domain-containing protein [Clostridium mobile]MBU5485757.1 cupin domain-containing protein [Clostridium mobile]
MFNFFISSTDTKNLIVRADKRKRIIFPESKGFSYELLSPDLSGDIEYGLMKLIPGYCYSDEPMCHGGEGAAYVIEGKVRLYLAEYVYILNTGDSIRTFPHMNHK